MKYAIIISECVPSKTARTARKLEGMLSTNTREYAPVGGFVVWEFPFL